MKQMKKMVEDVLYNSQHFASKLQEIDSRRSQLDQRLSLIHI
jgi:hypothetical protein